jgi:hypothetical protein
MIPTKWYYPTATSNAIPCERILWNGTAWMTVYMVST